MNLKSVFVCLLYGTFQLSSPCRQLASCPCDTLENDITDAQSAGGRIIVCGDMDGSTAEQDDDVRLCIQ